MKLTEAQVTEQIIGTRDRPGFLPSRGWKCIRLQSGTLRGPRAGWVKLGEPGMPDWLCLKRWTAAATPVDAFFIELKATGKKPSRQQVLWMEQARRDGYLCVWVDSLEGFEKWYRETFGQ